MLTPSWESWLKESLKQRPEGKETGPRVAVVGVGNEMAGDDAAGVRVARLLDKRLRHNPDRLVIVAGTAPENTTGALRRFCPDLVLLVDAADLDREPGSTAWIDWDQTTGFSASTHTLPLHVFARYLSNEMGCRVGLIGIQPKQTEYTAGMSPQVAQAAEKTAKRIADLLM